MSRGPAFPAALREISPALWAPALLSAAYAWAVVVSTFVRPGAIGLNYNAPGTDWMVMYAASASALAGHLGVIFDGDRFTAHLNLLFHGWLTQPLEFRPWVYPPSFLLILAPFSRLGFLGSYLAFQAFSAAALAAALCLRADRPPAARWIVLASLLSPAASINVVDGQCAFLVAALMIGAFRLAGTKPLLAGVLLGLLTFKPQFGLLAPVALIAARQWRVVLSACLTTAVLVILSTAVFGWEAWIAWAHEMGQAYAGVDPKWVTLGRLWGDSVFACAVLLGAPAGIASLLQSAAVIASAAATYATFRSRLRPDQKLAVLLATILIAAPHSASYDEVLLVVAAGLWVAVAPRPWPLWRGLIALACWLAPMIGPPLLVPAGRLLPLALAGFVAVVLAQTLRRSGADSVVVATFDRNDPAPPVGTTPATAHVKAPAGA